MEQHWRPLAEGLAVTPEQHFFLVSISRALRHVRLFERHGRDLANAVLLEADNLDLDFNALQPDLKTSGPLGDDQRHAILAVIEDRLACVAESPADELSEQIEAVVDLFQLPKAEAGIFRLLIWA